MSIFFLFVVIIIFERIESGEILFQCTLDNNDSCRLRSFDDGEEMIIESGNELSSSEKPIQPWSDVSSILKSTKNGHHCQIPYRHGFNPNDLYFCSNLSNSMNCLTTNGLEDQCQQGKHHILLLKNEENREFITPNITGASSNTTCLTFYYYVTKPDIILLLTDYLTEEGRRKLISGFTDVPFNGWHVARGSFKPDSASYRIIFRIYRADMSNLLEPFYVAFDQISVTEGNCGLLPPFEEIDYSIQFSTESIDERTLQVDSMNDTLLTDPFSITTHQSSTKEIENVSSQSGMFSTISSVKQTTNNETIDLTISVTTNAINSTIQPTDKSPLQYSLQTVLGLSIGLGIPAALGVIGSIIYLTKLIKRKKTKVLPFQQKDIPLKKTHRRHPQRKTHKKRKNFV